jgi:hypothetical protein
VLILAEKCKDAAGIDGSAYQFVPLVVERNGEVRGGGILLQRRLPDAVNEKLVPTLSSYRLRGNIQRYSCTGRALRRRKGAREIKPLYPVKGMARPGSARGSTRIPCPSIMSHS